MRPLRLILVDDERNVLEGLRRLLRPLRATWEVRTATSGVEALALLDAQPADVIVTDMRMPAMDGARLLSIVKERAPDTIRIVLSGQTDHATALRVIPLAHQFLGKPCDPVELLAGLSRIAHALESLNDATVCEVAGHLGWLPAAPTVCSRLTTLLRDELVDVTVIGHVIETDPALATKLLQLTNSPFFGVRRHVSSIVEAVTYLGLSLVRSLVVAFAVDDLPVRAASFDLGAFQRRSMRTAAMARYLAPRDRADDCFASGLLHDLGRLILASAMPARYDLIAATAVASGKTFEEEEIALGGCAPHRALGVYLLNVWGLPWSIVESIANHPFAPTVETKRLGPAGAVYLARQLLAEALDASVVVDLAFVERAGISRALDGFRAHAAELIAT